MTTLPKSLNDRIINHLAEQTKIDQELAGFLKGKLAKIVSKYNGQVCGRSRPALTGRTVKITEAQLNPIPSSYKQGRDHILISAGLVNKDGTTSWLGPCFYLEELELLD